MKNVKFIKTLERINKHLTKMLGTQESISNKVIKDVNMNLFEDINIILESENTQLQQELTDCKKLLDEIDKDLSELSSTVKRLKKWH